MKTYCKDKAELVQFVDDLLETSKLSSVLTMTIIPGQFGDYSVLTVIGESLVVTDLKAELSSFDPPTNTSPPNTQGG